MLMKAAQVNELDQAFLKIMELFTLKDERIYELESENKLLKEQIKLLQANEKSNLYKAEQCSKLPPGIVIDKHNMMKSIENEGTNGGVNNQHHFLHTESSVENGNKQYKSTIKSESDMNIFSRPTKKSEGKLIIPQDIDNKLYSPMELSFDKKIEASPNINNNMDLIISPLQPKAPGQSRNDVKTFLSEVQEKISPNDFKQFIKLIKVLTGKSQNVDRKEIFDNVRNLFGAKYKDLYIRFEQLLSVKK